MNRISRIVLVAAAAVLPLAALRAKEEKVAPGSLPRPVVAAVQARYKDLPIKAASSEAEKGKTVFEVSLDAKGRTIDVTVTPAGEIVKIEREIVREDLPKPVAQAVDAKYPGATWKRVEELTDVEKGKDTLAGYEVLLTTTQGKRVEVELAPDGKVSEVEEKGGAGGKEEKEGQGAEDDDDDD